MAARWLDTARHVAHGPFRVRRDNAQAGAGGFADDDGIANVDVQLFELRLVKKAIAVVADAADEGALTAELREADGRIGHRAAAYQARLALVEALQERLLLSQLDQAHGAALEAEIGEFLVAQLQKDVDNGVAEAANLKFLHAAKLSRRADFAIA